MKSRLLFLLVICCLAAAALFSPPRGVIGSSQPEPTAVYSPDAKLDPPDFVPGVVLARLVDSSSRNQAIFNGLSLTVTGYIPELDVYTLTVPPGREEATADLLAALPEVQYAEPDYYLTFDESSRTPNDTYYNQRQWYLRHIRSDAAWDTTTGKSTVIVAVLDSGADLDHPDLAGNLITGYDVIENDNTPIDTNGHGTNVAGLVGAVSNNNKGVAGVAWDVSIMPVKVGTLFITASNVAKGLRWAVDHQADIVNMSLSSESPANVVLDAVNYAYGKGVLLVASSGNKYEDGNPTSYPAAFEHVLAVAATDDQDEHASYSTSGDFVDVSAPGGDPSGSSDPVYEHWIFGLYRGDGYAYYSGTSQAAPLVSGLAALLLSAQSDLTPDQLAAIITSTAVDVQAPGKDPFSGFGRIDVAAAVAAVGNPPTPTPTMETTPTPTNTPTSKPTLTPTLTATPRIPPGNYLPYVSARSAAPPPATPTATPAVPGPPGQVTVRPNTGTYTDTIGSHWFFGEVQNGRAGTIYLVRVELVYRDADGTPVGTDFTYVKLDTIAPGDKACFSGVTLKAELPAGWSTLDFSVSNYFENAAPQPALPIVNPSGNYVPGTLPRYTLTGSVRNDSGSAVAPIEIAGTLYDAAGQVIACDSTTLAGGLSAGAQSPFTRDYRLRKDYDRVTSFRLQADDTGRD